MLILNVLKFLKLLPDRTNFCLTCGTALLILCRLKYLEVFIKLVVTFSMLKMKLANMLKCRVFPLKQGLALHTILSPVDIPFFPKYNTVHLGCSKLQGKRGKICICLLRVHFKKSQQMTYLMMLMRFFLIFFMKAYLVGTH